MGLFGNINILKGFWSRKRAFGSKIGLLGKIDVLKGLLGRKGAFESKMELSGKIDFLEGFLCVKNIFGLKNWALGRNIDLQCIQNTDVKLLQDNFP